MLSCGYEPAPGRRGSGSGIGGKRRCVDLLVAFVGDRRALQVEASTGRGVRHRALRSVCAILLVGALGSRSLYPQCAFEELRFEPNSRVSYSYFGQSIAASGDVVVLGHPYGIQSGEKTGLALVYRRTAGEWMLEATLAPSSLREFDGFGHEVAVYGKTIAVTAILDKEVTDDAGAVYLFRFDGAQWAEEQKLLPRAARPGLEFGHALALGPDRLVVGAPRDNRKGPYSGAAHIYRFDGWRWVREAEVFSPSPGGGNHFGWATALSGNVAAIGEPGAWDGRARGGAVSIFRRSPGRQWSFEQQLLSPDGSIGSSNGYSLALDDSWLLVGDPLDIPQGSFEGGAVDVFRFEGSRWTFQQKLRAPDPRDGSRFGWAVALLGDGALIGQINDWQQDLGGMAYVYRNHGGFFLAERRFASQEMDDRAGAAVAITEDSYWVGAPDAGKGIYRDSGVVYLFERDPIQLEFIGTPRAGQPVQFEVSAATGREGDRAVVLLSCTDGAAGIDIPGDPRRIPLTFDHCTGLSLTLGPLLQGTVDSSGIATTPLQPFPSIAPGVRFWASGITIDLENGGVSSVLCRITFETQ